MHQLLERQLKKLLPGYPSVPKELEKFISAVNIAYEEADQEHDLAQRSLDLISEEFVKLNKELEKDLQDIRDTKKKMKESESKLKTVFDGMPDGLLWATKSGKVLMMNKAISKLFGFSEKEIVGKNYKVFKFLTPKNLAVIAKALVQSTGERNMPPFELEIKTKNGTRLVEVSVSPWFVGGKRMGGIGIIRDITERKKAEGALKLTQFSIDHFGDAAFWMDKNAKFVYVNSQASKILGYAKEELLKMTVHDIDSLFTKKIWSGHWKAIRKKKHFTIESKHRKKNGTVFPVEISINYVRYGGKEYNIAFARDISERKKTEKKLTESEEKYRLLVMNGPDMIMLTAPDGKIKYISPQSKKVLGYTPKELIGRVLPPIFHDDDFKKVQQALISVMKGRVIANLEYRIIDKKGKVHWVTHSAIPIKENNKVVLIQSTVRDITEHKNVNEALKAGEEKFKSVVENAPNIIMTIRRDGEILFINRVVAGVDKEEVIGSSIYKYMPKKYQGEVKRKISQTFKNGEPNSYEIEGVGPKGSTAHYYTQIGPIKKNGKVVAVTQIITDITNLKEAYEKLKTLDELKTDFVHTVSHELRTPITSMKLADELIGRGGMSYKNRNEAEKIIRRNTKRMERTVNTILNFTTIESGSVRYKKKKIDLNKLVSNVIEDNNAFAESKGIKIRLRMGKTPKVSADPFWISVVVQDLIDNAIKFSGKGNVTVSVSSARKGVVIRIKDTGIGIKKADIGKVFHKFVKLHRHIRGSGTGLWTSKKVMEVHGGTIKLTSKGVGKGSKAEIWVPVKHK